MTRQPWRYTIRYVPKRGGGRRRILVPSQAWRQECRRYLPELQALAMAMDRAGVQHGFVPGCNQVTAAEVHIGYEWTLSVDLRACFDHLKVEMLPGLSHYRGVWMDGVAVQGLPTSPAICNIALAALDGEIVAQLAGRGVYTRYADDLVISCNDRSVMDEMLQWLPAAVSRHGHEIHPSKVRVQWSGAGRRIVNGIAVGRNGLAPTRHTRRTLRAAVHRLRQLAAWAAEFASTDIGELLLLAVIWQGWRVRGLLEWASCKRPDRVRRALCERHNGLREQLALRERSAVNRRGATPS